MGYIACTMSDMVTKKLKHENLRKYSVTKQKSALKKKVHCAVYQQKLFLLEIIYFLVLIGSKDILDPDQKDYSFSQIPFMNLQMKPNVSV